MRAPFDGQMGRHLVDPGNTVGGAGQQTVLAEIMQLDPIYVVANLSEQDVLNVRANLGQRRLTYAELVNIPVEVGIEKGTGFPYRGTIQYVAPQIDPQTGTLLVRGILHNPNRTLLPGFFVRIRLAEGPRIAGCAAGSGPGFASRPGRPLSFGRQSRECRRAALCHAWSS